jgi:hypothetical protein
MVGFIEQEKKEWWEMRGAHSYNISNHVLKNSIPRENYKTPLKVH